MEIVLNTSQSYRLSELAKALSLNDTDLFYIVQNIDGNDVSIAVTWATIVDAVGGGGTSGKYIISGGATWTGTGLVFDVSEIVYNYYGTQGTADATQITLDNGDSDPRFDLIVVTSEGVIEVIKGTPAESPAIPSVGEDQIAIQPVLIGAGSTTPTVTQEFVYRDNVDWTMSTYQSGGAAVGSVNFESTDNPYEGSFCIESNTSKTTGIRAQNDSPISLDTYTSLSFRIRFDTALPANRNLLASFWLDGAVVGTANFMDYGIQRELTGQWQQIVIPTSEFGAASLDRIQMRMDGGTTSSQVEYFLDYIVFSTGAISPPQLATITFQEDGTSIGTRPKLNFIPGSNITFSIVDDPINDRVNITINSSGGGGGTIAWGGIDGNLEDQEDLWNYISGLNDAIVQLNTDVTVIEGQITGIQTDITTLQGNITTINGQISSIETDVSTIEGQIVTINTDLTIIEGAVEALENAGFVTESDVSGTSRTYTKGQGFTDVALSISAGLVNWNLNDGNSFTLVLNANAELQLPSGSRSQSCVMQVQNSGGFAFTFAAGFNVDFIVGDTPTTTDTEYFLINFQFIGSNIWAVVTNQNA